MDASVFSLYSILCFPQGTFITFVTRGRAYKDSFCKILLRLLVSRERCRELQRGSSHSSAKKKAGRINPQLFINLSEKWGPRTNSHPETWRVILDQTWGLRICIPGPEAPRCHMNWQGHYIPGGLMRAWGWTALGAQVTGVFLTSHRSFPPGTHQALAERDGGPDLEKAPPTLRRSQPLWTCPNPPPLRRQRL